MLLTHRISALLMVLTLSWGISMHGAFNCTFNQNVEAAIQFDREKITAEYWDEIKMEGWSEIKNDKPWPTQQEFLDRLQRIENNIEQEYDIAIKAGTSPTVWVTRYRGGHHSYFDGVYIPMTQYVDSINKIGWYGSYGSHDIAKFNVKPSREFYRYVMTHPYGNADNKNIEASIQFDREKMVMPRFDYNASYKVEGYWASSTDTNKDWYKGHYPWPQPNAQPWPTQQEFLQRLRRIEKRIEAEDEQYNELGRTLAVKVVYMKGWSGSRLEPRVNVGTAEYHDNTTGTTIIWPQGYADHYIAKFNVKPSREFYTFVMKHPYGDAHNDWSRWN